jgi:predicted dehydrogenase
MSRPLRVAVVGCGGIAQMMHLPTLAERPDLFTIAGLADIDRETLDAVAARYHVARRTTDYRELVGRPEVEAVLVLASGTHREPVLASLAAGKPVFVEKPLAFGLEDAEAIAREAHRSGLPVQVGYHKRFDPAYRRARDEVARLRGLRFVEATVLHPDEEAYRQHHAILPVRPPAAPDEAEMDARAAREAGSEALQPFVEAAVGAGAPTPVRVAWLVLVTSLIHDVNLLRGVLGEPAEVLSAHAWRGGMAQTSLTRFPGDVRVLMTWISAPDLAHYEETVRFIGPDRRVTLTFPSPYLRHAPTALAVERMDGESLVEERHLVSYEEAFRAELHHFRETVLAGAPADPGPEEAVGDARWIEAIARAIAAASRADDDGPSADPGSR